MTPPSFVVLHGTAGADLHLLEYVRRVGLTLTFLGGATVLAYSGLKVADAIRELVADGRKLRERGR